MKKVTGSPRRTGGKRGSKGKEASVPSNREQVQAIREWAKAEGYEVSGRGRISRAIQEAFDAAH